MAALRIWLDRHGEGIALVRAHIIIFMLAGGCGQLDDRGSADDFVPPMVEGAEPPAPAGPSDAGAITIAPPNVVTVDALLPLIPPRHRSMAYAVPERSCAEGTDCADGSAGEACWDGFETCARSGLGGDCWDEVEGCFFDLTCAPFEAACGAGDSVACAANTTCGNALGCEADLERCSALGEAPADCLDDLTQCWTFSGLDGAAACAGAHRDCLLMGAQGCEATAEACMRARAG